MVLATKAELKAEQDEIIKLQAFDSSCFHDKSHFKDNGTQNYLVLQRMYRYFKKFDSGNHISVGKSKGLSDESIKPSAASDNSLASSLNYIGTKRRVKFEGQCLKQDEITFTYERNGEYIHCLWNKLVRLWIWFLPNTRKFFVRRI